MTDTAPKPKAKKPKPDDGLSQSERFRKAAREVGTDDDPARCAERIGTLAAAPASELEARKGLKPVLSFTECC